jgi:uncharacterized membrane protein YgcG
LAWIAASVLGGKIVAVATTTGAGWDAPLAPAAAVPAALRAAATWRSFCSASLASFSACSRRARISAIFFCFSASALSAATRLVGLLLLLVFLLLGQAQLLLRFFLALAFGQVDLLLAALGFLLLLGLLLRDGQRADRFLVLGIRLRDALLRLLCCCGVGASCGRGSGIGCGGGTVSSGTGIGSATGGGRSSSFSDWRRACARRRLRRRTAPGWPRPRVAGGGIGVALGRPQPGNDEDQRDQQVHQQRQRQGRPQPGSR